MLACMSRERRLMLMLPPGMPGMPSYEERLLCSPPGQAPAGARRIQQQGWTK